MLAARCNVCKETVRLIHPRDFRTCRCGNVCVNGDRSYRAKVMVDGDEKSYEVLEDEDIRVREIVDRLGDGDE